MQLHFISDQTLWQCMRMKKFRAAAPVLLAVLHGGPLTDDAAATVEYVSGAFGWRLAHFLGLAGSSRGLPVDQSAALSRRDRGALSRSSRRVRALLH